jgi:hypothetical protein
LQFEFKVNTIIAYISLAFPSHPLSNTQSHLHFTYGKGLLEQALLEQALLEQALLEQAL